MLPFFFDPTMFIVIPGIILTLWAQMKVSSAYKKYSRVRSRSGLTGAQVARGILDSNGLRAVGIEPIRGNLTDHYDPRSGILRLSEGVYGSQSIAALGIAAHEAGHAVQHGVKYPALALRTAIAPAAATGSQLGIWLFMIGILVSYFSGGMAWLMDAGIILFGVAVVFTLITLPVEFNASKRALLVLEKAGYLTTEELPHAKAVLDAAALTYVAAAATAVLTLIRLLILRGSRN
ncbi:MAG TPA: zinc metallopeptidase [Anaerolineae bacterium]|nr:zinc metallopeptidase [Anaerolineae bacterium]